MKEKSDHLPETPSWVRTTASIAPATAVVHAGFHIFQGQKHLAECLSNDPEFAKDFENGRFQHFSVNAPVKNSESLSEAFKRGYHSVRPTAQQIEELKNAGFGRFKSVLRTPPEEWIGTGLEFALATTALGSVIYLCNKYQANQMSQPRQEGKSL